MARARCRPRRRGTARPQQMRCRLSFARKPTERKAQGGGMLVRAFKRLHLEGLLKVLCLGLLFPLSHNLKGNVLGCHLNDPGKGAKLRPSPNRLRFVGVTSRRPWKPWKSRAPLFSCGVWTLWIPCPGILCENRVSPSLGQPAIFAREVGGLLRSQDHTKMNTSRECVGPWGQVASVRPNLPAQLRSKGPLGQAGLLERSERHSRTSFRRRTRATHWNPLDGEKEQTCNKRFSLSWLMWAVGFDFLGNASNQRQRHFRGLPFKNSCDSQAGSWYCRKPKHGS